jgi:hypothetical protein
MGLRRVPGTVPVGLRKVPQGIGTVPVFIFWLTPKGNQIPSCIGDLALLSSKESEQLPIRIVTSLA